MNKIWSLLRDYYVDRTGVAIIEECLKHPTSGDVVTLDVPGYCQTQDFTCGFVAGMMVTHSIYPNRSIDRFYRLCNPHKVYGMGTQKLAGALRKNGVAVGIRDDLNHCSIRNAIDSGYPIITCVHTGDEEIDHWVVIYGYGVRPNRVFLAGNGFPYLNRKEYDFKFFSSELWAPKGNGLICWGKG